jgi:hypothetical protein
MIASNNHTDRPHAQFSPSSLKYTAACAGWESRGGTSDAAEMGVRVHEAVEVRNPSGLRDEREQMIYEQLVEWEDKWIDTLFSADRDEYREIQLDIALPHGCDTFGTSDLVVVSGDTALVLDHKTGIGEIDPVEKNHQSKAYSIGVFQRFPQVRTIHAVFLVPQRGEELHGTYSRDSLDEMMESAARYIVAAKIARLKRVLGTLDVDDVTPNNGCSYCKHADSCPALGHLSVEIAARYSPELLPEGPIHSTEVEDPDVLGRLYTVACIVEKWAEGIKRKAVVSGLSGLIPSGFRMKSMGQIRSINDTLKFIEVAEEKLGLDKSELLQFAEFPFAKIRDHYAAKAERGKKASSAKLFEETLTEAGVVNAGAERFTLVKES